MAHHRSRSSAAADNLATVAVEVVAVAARLLKNLAEAVVVARRRSCIRRAGNLAAAVEEWSERHRNCKIAHRG
jgi:hypothetical protein